MSFFKKNENNQDTAERKNYLNFENYIQQTAVFPSIDENLKFIQSIIGKGKNLVVNRFQMAGGVSTAMVFIGSISDGQIIREHILTPLLQMGNPMLGNKDSLLAYLQNHIISTSNIESTNQMRDLIYRILSGDTVLLLDNVPSVLIIGSHKFEKKAIEKPENEGSVLASQESFTDDLDTNMSLILKRLPVPELQIEEFSVGTLTKTKVKLMWIKGITQQQLVDDVRNRLQKIKIDSTDGIGDLAELVEDNPSSIFPKYRQTERPDVATMLLIEGKAVILCANSPFAMSVPFTFFNHFRTIDDYADRSPTASYLRFVRFVAFLLSILISPLYLSFVAYNHTIVPPTLALNIAAGRQGVPFPSVLELLMLTFGMSIIREAGLRMTGSVGYFVGTLAAVLIGQAIVTAGYVSASLIIVVAISTIASFAISSTTLLYTSRLINYFLILLAGLFGVFGVINGLVILFWHLVSLHSFGTPYLSPIIPFDKEKIKEAFVRPSKKYLKNRMRLQSPEDQKIK